MNKKFTVTQFPELPGTEDGALPCHADPETWFASDSDHLSYAAAKCDRCPIKRSCLEGALQRREPIGMWGGVVFKEGRPISVRVPAAA